MVDNKHEHVYQCGVPGCSKIVTRMSQHLKRKHKIKSPAAIKEALKLFSKHSSSKTKRPSKPKAKSRKPAKTSSKPPASAYLTSKTSFKRKASSPSSLDVPEKKRQRRKEDEDDSTTMTESDSDESSWHSSGTHTSEEPQNSFLEKHLCDVQADLDDIHTFAEDDVDDYLCEPVDGKKKGRTSILTSISSKQSGITSYASSSSTSNTSRVDRIQSLKPSSTLCTWQRSWRTSIRSAQGSRL